MPQTIPERGLVVDRVSRSFGPVWALDSVSARFSEGEIHAVLGENGAGKSTLMNILSGFVPPDSGSVRLDGRSIPVGNPGLCKKLGIAMIHQHFTLVPGFSVKENLILARLTGLGTLREDALVSSALELAKELGWDVDVDVRTGELPVGAQQRVEILKALGGESKVAIFDEPTAVLSPREVEDLFRVLRRLKEAGKVVILIAHKLREVMAIADRVTVLRRGRVVVQALIADVSADQLAEWMVGEIPPPLHARVTGELRDGLTTRDLTADGDRGNLALRGIDLEVGRGEILGIGGVDGNGQVELAEVLSGVRGFRGLMNWAGEARSVTRGPRVAYIPQDRQTDGLALAMSIEDNLMIEGHRRRELTAGPFIRRRRAFHWAVGLIQRFDIKAGSLNDRADSLSGGNQQKVVVARALDETPDLLIAVNPSRGLDVKATEYVHRKILEARDQGAAVVLISTDLDELAALASRTVFLSRGRIVHGEGAAALLGGSA